MELRHLRSFVVLAQERHFGRAAELLGMAQPSLSLQLKNLEDELGTRLLDRTSRQVSLTEAGEVFLSGAKRVLVESERATAAVGDLLAGRQGRLVIGSLGAGLHGPLPELLGKMRATEPSISVELRHSNDSAVLERGLLTGALDVAVTRQVSANTAVVTQRLLVEPFVVYVPGDHHFAGRPQLRLSELADERFVSWPRHLGPAFYDVVTDACHAQGFVQRVEAIGDSLEAQLALVAAGSGVSVQALSNVALSRRDVVAVPLHPHDISASLHIAHHRWRVSTALKAFLAAARTPQPGVDRP